MSSYQIYRPTHFNQYVSDVSPEDFVNVIQTKQKQYDTNYDRIQSEINNIYNLPILREQDKEYLRGKEQELLSHINKHSNLDVGDNRNASYLMGNVHKIYQDPNILNAVESTSKIQTFMKNVDELKKSHPDKYDANTEAWDMRAYQDYISGKTNTYNGPTTPTIAQDVDKKAMDAYSKMKQTYMGSEGGKDFSGITSERIAAQLKATLSDADQKQLYINAWANGMLNPSLAPRLIETQNSHIKEYEEKRKEYEANKQFDKVKEMDANIKGTQAYIKRIQENPENGLFEDYFTHYVGGIAEANEIQEVKSDAVYLQKQRMDFDAQQAKDKRKFDEDKYKFEQEQQNLRNEAQIQGRLDGIGLKNSGKQIGMKEHLVDIHLQNTGSQAKNEDAYPVKIDGKGATIENVSFRGWEIPSTSSVKEKDKIGLIMVDESGNKFYISNKDAVNADYLDASGKIQKDITNTDFKSKDNQKVGWKALDESTLTLLDTYNDKEWKNSQNTYVENYRLKNHTIQTPDLQSESTTNGLKSLFPLESPEEMKKIETRFNKYKEDNSNLSPEEQLDGFKKLFDNL